MTYVCIKCKKLYKGNSTDKKDISGGVCEECFKKWASERYPLYAKVKCEKRDCKLRNLCQKERK